jgi:predicted amidohydrolase
MCAVFAAASAAETDQTSHLKVAAAQLLTDTVDLDQNKAKIVKAIRDASVAGCDVVLFHEGCLTGYPTRDRIQEIDFQAVRQAEKEICRLARELGIAVLLGSTGEINGQYFNYVLVINQNGRVLGTYDKTWRAGEPHYCAGEGPVVFRIAGVESTVIICHDLRYPELVRLAVAAGARVVFIANNESGITQENKLLGYRSMQISRATENLVYSVMCNSPADPEDVDRPNCSHGNSKIVDPLGNVLDEATVFEERLVIADLQLDEATGGPATRTLGENPATQKLYGVDCENDAYAAWIRAGLKLVRRLDGSRVPAHLQ